jgi:hypothetical protein
MKDGVIIQRLSRGYTIYNNNNIVLPLIQSSDKTNPNLIGCLLRAVILIELIVIL